VADSSNGCAEPPTFWCCIRCGTWTQIDRDQLCADCVGIIDELIGRSRSLRADMVMFDGEEP